MTVTDWAVLYTTSPPRPFRTNGGKRGHKNEGQGSVQDELAQGRTVTCQVSATPSSLFRKVR